MRFKLFGGREHSTTNLSVLFPNVGAVPKNSLATPGKFTFICHIKRVFFFCEEGTADETQRTQRTSARKAKLGFWVWMFGPCCWSVGAACFTTHENKPFNLIFCKTGSDMGGKMRNIAIQLVFQWHAVKTSCTFFVARWLNVHVLPVACINEN